MGKKNTQYQKTLVNDNDTATGFGLPFGMAGTRALDPGYFCDS